MVFRGLSKLLEFMLRSGSIIMAYAKILYIVTFVK
jgi:hypothetical protein